MEEGRPDLLDRESIQSRRCHWTAAESISQLIAVSITKRIAELLFLYLQKVRSKLGPGHGLRNALWHKDSVPNEVCSLFIILYYYLDT